MKNIERDSNSQHRLKYIQPTIAPSTLGLFGRIAWDMPNITNVVVGFILGNILIVIPLPAQLPTIGLSCPNWGLEMSSHKYSINNINSSNAW